MTQLSSGTLRLRAGADTLVIGHRSTFGYGRGLSRLESEDEVRRQLIQAMADGSALQFEDETLATTRRCSRHGPARMSSVRAS